MKIEINFLVLVLAIVLLVVMALAFANYQTKTLSPLIAQESAKQAVAQVADMQKVVKSLNDYLAKDKQDTTKMIDDKIKASKGQ